MVESALASWRPGQGAVGEGRLLQAVRDVGGRAGGRPGVEISDCGACRSPRAGREAGGERVRPEPLVVAGAGGGHPLPQLLADRVEAVGEQVLHARLLLNNRKLQKIKDRETHKYLLVLLSLPSG